MLRHETLITLTFGELPKREAFIAHVQPLVEDGFPIVLVDQGGIASVVEAVNQGIDSHLEAVLCEQFTDTKYPKFPKWGLRVKDAASLHTLLRRLIGIGEAQEPEEDETPPALDLCSSIMYVLGYEWV